MRVVIAEDSLLVREGIAQLLRSEGIDIVGEVSDAAALHRLVATEHPNVAVVDIKMPPTHTDEGLVAAKQIRGEHASVAVLVLSQYLEPEFALQLLSDHTGHIGYLLKERVFTASTLVDALNRIHHGEVVIDPAIVSGLLGKQRRHDPLHALTPREREVLSLVAEGLSNKAIAAKLFVAERTVEAHVTRIFLKFDLDDEPSMHRRVTAVLTYLRG